MRCNKLQTFVVCFFVLIQSHRVLTDGFKEEIAISTTIFPKSINISDTTSTTLEVTTQKPPKPQESFDAMKYVCGFIPEKYMVAGINDSEPLIKYRVTTMCCSGHKKDVNGNCRPHCEGGCGEGYCAKPGICFCHNIHCAFIKSNRTCECQTCKGGCGMGVCMANNYCHCYPGSKLRSEWITRYTNSSIQCIPYCYPFCTNSFFTEPEKCECEYSSDEEDDSNSLEFHFGGKKRKSKKRLHKLFKQNGLPSTGLQGTMLGSTFGSGNRQPYSTNQEYYSRYGKNGNVFSKDHDTGSFKGWDVPSSSGAFETSGHHSGWVVAGTSGLGSSSNYGTSGYGNSGNNGWNVPGSSGTLATGGHNSGRVVQGSSGIGSSSGYGTNGLGIGANYGSSGSFGTSGRQSGWVVPGSSGFGSSSGFGTSGNSNRGDYGWNVPGSSGTSATGGHNPGWVVPGSSGFGSSSGYGNSGNSNRGNYGWNVPGSSGTSGTGGHNSGWVVPGSSGFGSSSGFGTSGHGNGGNYGSSGTLGNSGRYSGSVVPSSSGHGSSSSLGFGTGATLVPVLVRVRVLALVLALVLGEEDQEGEEEDEVNKYWDSDGNTS
ncbi:hypothetical protein C0J52_04155 [Blattella germanica]|nr:hypothetical protein C0J52_04155 [Blattella germanica]